MKRNEVASRRIARKRGSKRENNVGSRSGVKHHDRDDDEAEDDDDKVKDDDDEAEDDDDETKDDDDDDDNEDDEDEDEDEDEDDDDDDNVDEIRMVGGCASPQEVSIQQYRSSGRAFHGRDNSARYSAHAPVIHVLSQLSFVPPRPLCAPATSRGRYSPI